MAGVARQVHEVHRHDGRVQVAGRYLKRVLYGNKVGINPEQATNPNDFHFEVVLDYGEHDAAAPKPTPNAPTTNTWLARKDAFSSYRAGFEVRTYRLCRRILMFHRFAELDATAPTDGSIDANGNAITTNKALLVRSTDFTYEERSDVTYLTRATHKGYALNPNGQGGSGSNGSNGIADTYLVESLPPADFEYSRADTFSIKVHDLDPASARQLTSGPTGRDFQWVDLNGEGIAGALTQQGGALFYKRNLGGGKLGPATVLRTQPHGAAIGSGGRRGGGRSRGASPVQQLVDLTGDGLPDFVELGGPGAGFHARTADGGWAPKAHLQPASQHQLPRPVAAFHRPHRRWQRRHHHERGPGLPLLRLPPRARLRQVPPFQPLQRRKARPQRGVRRSAADRIFG